MDQLDITMSHSGALAACMALRESYGLEINDLRAMAHVAHMKNDRRRFFRRASAFTACWR